MIALNPPDEITGQGFGSFSGGPPTALDPLEISDMMDMKEDVIRVEDLTKVYQMGEIEVHALRGVSFTVKQGEVLAIMDHRAQENRP